MDIHKYMCTYLCIYADVMSDKSVCDVSIGEETVDARSPNFAFLSNEREAHGTGSGPGP